MAERERLSRNDHDLLLNIDSKINNFIEVYKNYTETNGNIIDDHERRIRWIERTVIMGLGGLAMIEIFFKFNK